MIRRMLLCLLLAPAAHALTPYAPLPDIQARVDQLSADTLLATVSRLDGFYSRHTYSDTTSEIYGIGAALRWVEATARGYDALGRFTFEKFAWTQPGRPTRHILIARVSGTAVPRGRYLIGGHLDSRTVTINDTGRAPGADDNASSCAALLELLRILPDTIQHDLEVIWFTGEEQGLWGSAAYADHLAASGARVDGVVAMDMISHITLPGGQVDSTSCRLYAQGLTSQGGSSSVSRVWQRSFHWSADDYVPEFNFAVNAATDRPGRGSDHISFSEAGYPALRVIERNEDLAFQHNANDLTQYVSPGYARKVSALTLAGLLNALLAPLRPPPPRVEVPVDMLGIFVADTVALPDGGDFFLAIRGYYSATWDTVINLGGDRFYPFDWGTPGELYGFALARSDAQGHVSPFSGEVVSEDVEAANRRARPVLPANSIIASPNPFNDELRLEIQLTQSGPVELRIFDLLGREVALLAGGYRASGAFTVFWEPHDAATGIYVVNLRTPSQSLSHKLLYLR
ncbi:M20/M25/M40 family metallo-hydrolase [candidate division KSB1 bacterium]|nr:M20/M25/M40 family metallo-hydrolase [candidate division KSB1 bacterium]